MENASRKELLLHGYGDKLVQLGWQKPNSPELEAHIDLMRQHASEDQIEGLTKAIEQRIEGGAGCGATGCGCKRAPEGDRQEPGIMFSISAAGLHNAGYATPIATLQTAVWTGLGQSADAYFDCFTAEIKDGFRTARAARAANAVYGTAARRCLSCEAPVRGLRVYAQHFASDTEAEVEYELDVGSDESRRLRQPLRKIDEAWKISGPPRDV